MDRDKLIIILIVLISLVYFIHPYTMNLMEAVQGGKDVYAAPVYGTIQCLPSTGLSNSRWTYIRGSGTLIKPSNFGTIDKMIVKINLKGDKVLRRVGWKICNNPNSCSATDDELEWHEYSTGIHPGHNQPNDIYREITLTNKQSIFIKHQYSKFEVYHYVWIDSDRGSTSTKTGYDVLYTPFVLWRYEPIGGGGILKETNIKSCNVPSDWYGKSVVSSTDTNVQINRTNNPMYPYESYNYVYTFVTVPNFGPRSVENYNGKEAFCDHTTTGAVMRPVLVTVTKDGTRYHFPDTNSIIGNVDCCGNEVIGNQMCVNHTWTSISEGSECSITNPCPLNQWSIDTSDSSRKTIIKQDCVNGKCVLQSKEVQCASDYACGNGEVCRDWKCVNSNESSGLTPVPSSGIGIWTIVAGIGAALGIIMIILSFIGIGPEPIKKVVRRLK